MDAASVSRYLNTLTAAKHFPFRITSAPDIFQKKMNETMQGLEGVKVFMNYNRRAQYLARYGDAPH